MSDKPIDRMLDALEWSPLQGSGSPPIDGGRLPVATHEAILTFGTHQLRVYQLDDGRRIIQADDLAAFFGATPPATPEEE